MNSESGIQIWEAHRGGGGGTEMPESCMAAFEYGWLLGGRPEADVNVTADGEIVSVHDATLDRIVPDLPEAYRGRKIGEMTRRELALFDTGGKEYPGSRVPTLRELFEKLRARPERGLILDYKNVPLPLLSDLITACGVARQLTFASCDIAKCKEMKALQPDLRIKVWHGGSRREILDKFAALRADSFGGFEEIQLHLNDRPDYAPGQWRYQLSPEDLCECLRATAERGVLLQVLPWQFERRELLELLKLGIRSFAVDYPARFIRCCAEYFAEAR